MVRILLLTRCTVHWAVKADAWSLFTLHRICSARDFSKRTRATVSRKSTFPSSSKRECVGRRQRALLRPFPFRQWLQRTAELSWKTQAQLLRDQLKPETFTKTYEERCLALPNSAAAKSDGVAAS